MTKERNETIRAALVAYRAAHNLSLSELSQQFGYSSSTLSRYLNPNSKTGLQGDVAALESVIADVLKSEGQRVHIDATRFETNITKMVSSCCELARKTNDIALISGPAGIGKTVGLEMYHARHPSSVLITAWKSESDDRGMIRALARSVDMRGWSGNTPKAMFLHDHFRKSNRVILIDNAHRLRRDAFDWLFDFHDATECPIVFCGNPEVLISLRSNDQRFSRIGLNKRLALSGIREAAHDMLKALDPAHAAALLDDAECVAEQRGHLRALRKQILLAASFRETPAFKDAPEKAFKDAHKNLLRDYALSE